MRAKSCSTTNIDSYCAGLELGENLARINPEVVLTHFSPHFDVSEFTDGIYDGLGSEDVIIFGGSGNGVYETQGFIEIGASALGINNGNKWHVEFIEHIDANAYECAKICTRNLLKQCENPPPFLLIQGNGLEADYNELLNGINSVLDVPCFGGLASDNRQHTNTKTIVNRSNLNNALTMLAPTGPIQFAGNCASGWKPIASPGIVTEQNNRDVAKIGNQRALDFMQEQYGKPVSDAEVGLVPLAEMVEDNFFLLHSYFKINADTGTINFISAIPKNATVRVCDASIEDVLGGAAQCASFIDTLSFKPACVIVISCAGRQWILADRANEELERIMQHLEQDVPLVGYPSFGEFGPFRKINGDYSANHFHNNTVIVLALG